VPEQKFFWIGLAAALIAGLSLGLTYAWLINPVEYYDSDPLDLRADLREDYVVLVALSYSLNGDLAQTQTRLSSLGQAGAPQAIASLADKLYRAGGHAETVRAAHLHPSGNIHPRRAPALSSGGTASGVQRFGRGRPHSDLCARCRGTRSAQRRSTSELGRRPRSFF